MKSRYANGLLLIPIVRNKIIMHSGAGVIKNYFFSAFGKYFRAPLSFWPNYGQCLRKGISDFSI